MAKKRNYVNNKDLLAALIAYRESVAEAEEGGEKKPQVPDYIGKCIMMIAQRLATRPNFSGYMYKEEMISDGIENCLQYIHNFNPEKSQNPFAYFTQIIWYAFLRRIDKEKKQLYIKHKVTENSVISGTAVDGASDGDDAPSYIDLDNDYMTDFVKNYEKKMDEKKAQQQKRAKKGLEKFIDNEE